MKKTLLLKRNFLFFSFLTLLATASAQYEVGLSLNQDFGNSHVVSRYTSGVQKSNVGATSIRADFQKSFWKSRLFVNVSLGQSFISAKGTYYATGQGAWNNYLPWYGSKEEFNQGNRPYGIGGDTTVYFSDHNNRINILLGTTFLKRFEFSFGLTFRTTYASHRVSYLSYQKISTDAGYRIYERRMNDEVAGSGITRALIALRLAGRIWENEKNALKLEYTFRYYDKYDSHNIGLMYSWKRTSLKDKKNTTL